MLKPLEEMGRERGWRRGGRWEKEEKECRERAAVLKKRDRRGRARNDENLEVKEWLEGRERERRRERRKREWTWRERSRK